MALRRSSINVMALTFTARQSRFGYAPLSYCSPCCACLLRASAREKAPWLEPIACVNTSLCVMYICVCVCIHRCNIYANPNYSIIIILIFIMILRSYKFTFYVLFRHICHLFIFFILFNFFFISESLLT